MMRSSWFWLMGAVAVGLAMLMCGCGCGRLESGGREGSASERGVSAGEPRAVVEQRDCWLGIVDAASPLYHDFAIRNEGTAPLELRRGGTSCRCTMSDLPGRPIPPGGLAMVRVSTKAEGKEGRFWETAKVFTNDPAEERIRLRMGGVIQTYLGFEPPRLVLSEIARSGVAGLGVLMYSQVWRSFSVEEISSSLEGMTWELSPAGRGRLESVEAKCGYELRLGLPAGLPGGSLRARLEVTVTPEGSSRRRRVEYEIVGRVAARASITGEHLDGSKVLRIGVLRHGQGSRQRLTLRIRDEHRQLRIKRIETVPEYLRIEVVPCNPDRRELGLYWVKVEVPKDAPVGDFMGYRQGEIRIETDHPEIPEFKLGVEFAVTSS